MNYQEPVTVWAEFQRRWGGLHNFLISGELIPRWPSGVPTLERIIEETRRDPNAIFRSGVKQAAFDQTDVPEGRTMPLDRLLARPFVLAYFGLVGHLDGKGQVFEGLEENWVGPWRSALTSHGFTFDKITATLFVSGPHSATNYHMDLTHQLACQWHGTKHFHGLKDPDRWTTPELRGQCDLARMVRPAAITPDDVYTIVQPPDTMLWNAISTPHWVETFEKPAATLTLVHGGLRLDGRLCPHAEEIIAWRASHEAAKAS